MSKKFNLNLSKINSKKVPVVAKIESLYNINYEELDISGTEKEKLIKYENDITFHKERNHQNEPRPAKNKSISASRKH